MKINSNSYYQIQGGALPINAPSYVPRQADEDLYAFACSDNPRDFVSYVLAARQMGKSSLKVRTAHRLTQEGFLCVTIDLQIGFGDQLSEEKFYKNLLYVLCKQIPGNVASTVKEESDQFWDDHADILPAIKFKECLEDVILPKVKAKRVIIFIDEIQKLVHWDIHNSFLSLIRGWADENGGSTLNHDPKENIKNSRCTSIKFVLLGVVKPYDLLTSAAFNIAKPIALQNLSKNTEPLLEGLKNITKAPEKLLEVILFWTGGNPFLTQLACYCICQGKNNKLTEVNIEDQVEQFVRDEIIQNWRSKDPQRQNHFSEVERWFTQGYTDKRERLEALRIYDQILRYYRPIRFDPNKKEHVNLLISGLVSHDDSFINLANRIYKEVFDRHWSKDVQESLNNQEDGVSLMLLDRRVYVLVDRSATMDHTDNGQNKTRWEILPELLEGDFKNIFRVRGNRRICEELDLYLFSRDRIGRKFTIHANPERGISPEQLKVNIFDENFPDSNTYIVPTIERCKQDWMDGARREGKKAFIIIYTDGMLDDRPEFETWITTTCRELEDEKELKIIMLGLGDDVQNNLLPFLNLDANTRHNVDKNGNPCNVFTFDLVKAVEDIIDVLGRQLENDPNDLEAVIPDWVKERFPEWYRDRLAEQKQ